MSISESRYHIHLPLKISQDKCTKNLRSRFCSVKPLIWTETIISISGALTLANLLIFSDLHSSYADLCFQRRRLAGVSNWDWGGIREQRSSRLDGIGSLIIDFDRGLKNM